MDWQCKNCGNEVDEEFDICWSCGASRAGETNPQFFPEVDAAESTPDELRTIHCGKCGYRGECVFTKPVGDSVELFFKFVLHIEGVKPRNRTCPKCGETRDIYDWKSDR